MEASLIAREYDPQSLVLADASDQLLSQCFKINFGKGEGWTIELLLPVVALRQLEPLLSNSGPDEQKLKDPLWQNSLARQMGHIRLPARTVLARPSLTLNELLNLRNGDVIPVNIARSLPLIVGNRVIAHGNVGEQNGRAAFMIESIVKDQSQ
jgi:flagellar motor switch protein FliM